jgi:hypothetical protein
MDKPDSTLAFKTHNLEDSRLNELSVTVSLLKKKFQMAESCGFQLNVDTGKELGRSLDEIERLSKTGTARNPMVARMLRMMATRLKLYIIQYLYCYSTSKLRAF